MTTVSTPLPTTQCPTLTDINNSKGTDKGSPCVFPFTYKGNIYYGCTTVDAEYSWCSTTSDYEKKWGVCLGNHAYY